MNTVPTDFEAKKQSCVEFLNEYAAQLTRKKAEYLELTSRPYAPQELLDFFIDFRKIFHNFTNATVGHDDIFAMTPWKNVSHVVHNLGGTGLHSMTMIFETKDEYFDDMKDMFIQNVPYFIEQTISHLKSIMGILQQKDQIESQEKTSLVLEAMQVVIRARLFNSHGLKVAGISDKAYPKSPTARMLCDANLTAQIPLHELIEILYTPVSNADRIMNSEASKRKSPEGLNMDISAREINHEGMKYLVLECFNTGKLVDLTSLHEKMMSIDEADIAAMTPDLLPIIRAIKKGSRQAHFQINEGMLIMDGLTLESGGTGIGLADLHRQLILKNGLLLLNNVYDPKAKGFCITIILPQTNDVPIDGLHRNLRNLKDLLSSGELFLPELSQEAKVG